MSLVLCQYSTHFRSVAIETLEELGMLIRLELRRFEELIHSSGGAEWL